MVRARSMSMAGFRCCPRHKDSSNPAAVDVVARGAVRSNARRHPGPGSRRARGQASAGVHAEVFPKSGNSAGAHESHLAAAARSRDGSRLKAGMTSGVGWAECLRP